MIETMTMPLSSLDSVVCTQTLDKLSEDLGPDYTSRFVVQFCSMWPTRLKRLEEALRSCNSDAGEDAALSLKSGASMVGARELAELAEWLHGAFRDKLVDVQRKLIAMIREVGLRSIQVLSTMKIG
ncbi:Hpt domain-containing protein [Paeniglutamicibacter kerguelensis]|uniref:HPt (Histidine-containing phosphotransfer) domain-containing protein n=1 Tax=Paeniglutamicibacter kerguelensis TaxID=254788 RepID=A0ABS4XJP4_9MICC|nr:Hpt domain-containing protein [Paeniglutamicibacter kerguelensis]MBP2388638.1 HPt (histidine-containing phosphotransfer) domain-containing protein [Paeniglutamicibacter kerguelensis]